MKRCVTLLVAVVGLGAILLAVFGGAATTARAGQAGAEVTLTVTSAPPTVSQGHSVTYVIRAHSDSTSNLSHFTITAPVAGSTSPFPLLYAKTSRPDVCTAPSDPPAPPAQGGITCSFGAFPSGSPDIVFSLVFNVPSSLADGSVDFAASASYSGGSNNDNSGRTNVVTGSTTTGVGTGPDLTKGFVVSALGDTLATLTAPDGDQPGNPQSASASLAANAAPGFGVVGTVQEIPHPIGDTTTDCGPGASCWGQTELVTYLDFDGVDVTLGQPSPAVIRTDRTEIPNGVTKNNIQWFHNGLLLPSCSGSTVPTNGCVQGPVQKLQDGDLLTTILASHYGPMRP